MYGNVRKMFLKNPHFVFESYLVSTIYKIRALMMITKRHTTPIRPYKGMAMILSLSTVMIKQRTYITNQNLKTKFIKQTKEQSIIF